MASKVEYVKQILHNERTNMSNITYGTQKTGVTRDYSIFKYFDRNRIVSKTNVEKLRQDMLIHGQKDEVIVNERWQVIDGQHRIAALEKVIYEVANASFHREGTSQYFREKYTRQKDMERLNAVLNNV